MLSVLFIDGDSQALEDLRSALRPRRSEWDVSFVGTGAEALERLGPLEVDVVVSELDLADMSGIDLMKQIKGEHPEIVRILASRGLAEEHFLEAMSVAHRYVEKPYQPGEVGDVIASGTFLRDLLDGSRVLQFTANVTSFPSRPGIYAQILEESRSATSSLERVGAIVSHDPAMTAKVLQLVNSAHFGLSKTITSPEEAAVVMGLDAVKSLVVSLETFGQLRPGKECGVDPERLWDHSMRVASLARTIARLEGEPRDVVEDSFLAGMLHDAGKLVLGMNMPDRLIAAIRISGKFNLPGNELERRVIGVSHAQIGAYIFSIWGLPMTVVEAIAWHHEPSLSSRRGFCELTALHAADGIEKALAIDTIETVEAFLDMDYLSSIGLAERLPAWVEACREALGEEDDVEDAA
ncbi:MAG: response regulator [bacterium]|nr:response regulator [bacterium]